MSFIPLTLGPILFDETSLETPEALAEGLTVLMAIHDFPGGVRTVQTFGIFADPIRFRGKISRPDALDRILQMKAVVAAQQPLQFIFGPLSWVGFVRKFVPVVLSQWRGEYEVEFVPVVDLTLGSQDDGTPSDEQQLNDQTSAIQSATGATPSGTTIIAPAGSPLAQQLDSNPGAFTSGGYSFGPAFDPNTGVAVDGSDGNLFAAAGSPVAQQLDANPSAFTSNGMSFGPAYVAAPDGNPLPTQLAAPVGGLLGSVNAGMANAGGVVANLAPADALTIANNAQALSVASSAIVASTAASAGLVATAAMLGARASVISSIVSAASAPRWTLNIINPNLMLLASQYYGDASQWETIAAANGLADPQPLGQFQLTIPAAP